MLLAAMVMVARAEKYPWVILFLDAAGNSSCRLSCRLETAMLTCHHGRCSNGSLYLGCCMISICSVFSEGLDNGVRDTGSVLQASERVAKPFVLYSSSRRRAVFFAGNKKKSVRVEDGFILGPSSIANGSRSSSVMKAYLVQQQ